MTLAHSGEPTPTRSAVTAICGSSVITASTPTAAAATTSVARLSVHGTTFTPSVWASETVDADTGHCGEIHS